LSNEQLISTRKNAECSELSERKKPNSSAYYSYEDISSFENLCIGEWSSEIAEYKTLLSKKKNVKLQNGKEVGEPSCSISFENNLSDSICVLKVNLEPQSLMPADLKFDEETQPHRYRSDMGNRIMFRNVPPHTTGMSRQRSLRLRTLFRVMKNNVAKFFDGKMKYTLLHVDQ
ncbi:hypothetical protein NPIL_458561, partial [Nephila pilipes]